MKERIKGIITGVIATAVVMSVVSVAAQELTKNAVISYNNVKICIDGTYLEPKDANGNTVEPFIMDGTTYLPVRAVAGAFGKAVEWDGATSTVFLGQRPADASAIADGSRSNPYGAEAGITVPFNKYSFYPTNQLQITCSKVIRGEAGTFLASKENSNNKVTTNSQEWMFVELELTHVSSSEGEDDDFEASDLLYYKECFYKPDGSALPVNDSATFGDIYGGYRASDIKLFPGGKSKVVIGVLTDKYDGDVLLKVPYDDGKKNHWIRCNSDTNVISTMDQLNEYLELNKAEENENQSVKITLRTKLPATISEFDYSGNRKSSATITDYSCKVDNSRATISFIGEKTYDSEGSGQSRAVKVGWKLYDGEGYVIKSGTANSTSIKMGEKFKNCEDTIYSLEPGTYELEIMSVN